MAGLKPGEGGLDGLKELMHQGVPSLHTLLDPVIEEMDPANCIEEQFKVGLCDTTATCMQG